MTEASQEVIPPIKDPNQLELFEQALEVERERIRSQDKRTEVVRAAIEANDASDKRQFEFHMAKLDDERNARAENSAIERERLHLAKWIAASFGVAVIGLCILFSIMLFFGSATQSATALNILGTVGKGIAGFGIIYAVVVAFRTLLRRR
ncbi:hypothetical protein H261_15225 [Paramagnetospirillum caucaseum]|uniref:Uncharacterized protein n=1 Tax=Paramagnetospirillum caucaseum TaxID=1244869 RepID=M2Y7T8_9PROT|nr:hypothetical protein [Paramagnetospirillum caucaseum]EME69096.1 hypothetical protein H261_15225 [Paramagnetospirillum caucaseum]